MDRRTLRSAGLALLSILALALAAATLSSPVSRRGGGLGEGAPLAGSLPRTGPRIVPDSFGRGLVMLLLAAVLVALLVYGIYYALKNGRRMLAILLAFAALFGLLALLGWAYPRNVPLPPLPHPRLDGTGAEGTGGGTTGPPAPSPPPLALLLAGALVVAVAALLLRRRRARSGTVPSDSDGEGDEESEAAAMARAAGAAADRIDAGGDVGNEVYRAWREMTDLLSLPSPRARTPGEFADAAVAAGMDADDVRELTRLFEDVRYGDDEPTPAMERRAGDVLRRIEETYAAADADAEGDA